MKNINWNDVQEETFSKLTKGGYICKIVSVEDVESEEYLNVEIDISEGPFAHYFQSGFEKYGAWPFAGHLRRYYGQKSLGYFKAFISALEKSNRGFTWTAAVNANPKLIVGLEIGVVFGEKEYISTKDGGVKCSLSPFYVCSTQTIEDGSFSVPERKTVSQASNAAAPAPSFAQLDEDDGDLPF